MAEKILIVDDDVDSLKLIGLMLQRHGYEVIAANAGNQALTKAISDLPDLIILDVMMPDMNGYEVCRRLRSDASTHDIPIIMFTAKTLIDDKVAGFEAGADDYLTKPTHPAELASRVKAILERNASKHPKEADRGMTVGVVAAKGGIGATTITLNLGAALQQMDENPIVADLRLGVGSLGLFMGLGRSTGMANVLSKPASEITAPVVEQELVSHQSGLRALLSSSRPQEALLDFPAERVEAVVRELRASGKPVIFDLGSGFTPLLSQIQAAMDQLIVLVEPNGVTLSMARELLQELKKREEALVHVAVVNRTQNNLQPAWHEVEHVLDQEILAIISAAPELAYQATEAGTPIVNFQPNAIVSSQLNKLAEDIRSVVPVAPNEGVN